MSKVNRLLERQIRKNFGSDPIEDERVLRFIEMVNDSYQHYEANHNLLDRAMEISTEELKTKNAELRDVNESLDDFNHGISHDLQTHAFNVISLVKMLKKYQEKGDLDKVGDIIEHLEKTGQAFVSVIGGFLEVSRYERKLSNKVENIQIKEVIDTVLEELYTSITESKTTVNCKLEFSSLPFPEEQLRSIIRNLVSNSIKYCHSQRPCIIDVHGYEKDGKKIISIRDNGKGFELEKNRHRLFKMFNRFEMDSSIEGTGIGLFIVKKLLNKNNAEIEMSSRLNEFTQCTLTFNSI